MLPTRRTGRPTMSTCKFCGQPATIHLTDILNQQKNVTHLCEACARAKQILPDQPGSHFDVQGLVQLVMGQHESAGEVEPNALTCPSCGLKYSEFRKAGRLGCALDYDEFNAPLLTLLERVHRSTDHCGKVPGQRRSTMGTDRLQADLDAAIAAERYEDAAVLRDRIRQKEGADEPR